MRRHLDNFKRKFLRGGKADGKSQKTGFSAGGQVAVILIFLTAILLVFYAVVLNLGRVSQTKTMITIASNQAAAFMGSEMASYAESWYQHGGGEGKYGDDLTFCKWAEWVVSLITFIVLAILVVITILTFGATLPLLIAVAVATVLNIAAIVMQAAVLQPGLINQWNQMYRALNLDTVDEFLERGVILGLQGSVSDNTQIPDLYDDDNDGLYADPMSMSAESEKISRFGFEYSQRLARLAGNPSLGPVSVGAVENFQHALRAFLFKGGLDAGGHYVESGIPATYWGMWDHIGESGDGGIPYNHYCSPGDDAPGVDHYCCDSNTKEDECNCCCLPKAWGWVSESPHAGHWGGEGNYFTQPNNNADEVADVPNLRPACCEDLGSEGSPLDGETCGSAREPACPAVPYNFVYDSNYENNDNNIVTYLNWYCNYAKGDVSLDGVIDINDYNALLNRIVSGTVPGWPSAPLADVNGDGVINIADVIYLGNYITGTGAAPVVFTTGQCPLSPTFFVSFREFIGRDDGMREYRTQPPGDFSSPQVPDSVQFDVSGNGTDDQFFRGADARGVFATFWNIARGVTLPFYDEVAGGLSGFPLGCRWCTPYIAQCDGTNELRVPGLPDLPNCQYADYAAFTGGAPINNLGCCVTQDDFDTFPNVPNMLVEPLQCVEADLSTGWWKQGVDDFCSTTWPYNENCIGKHCAESCTLSLCIPQDEDDDFPLHPGCEVSDTALCDDPGYPAYRWTDDELDEFVDQINEFIDWAYKVVSTPARDLIKDFRSSLRGQLLSWLKEGSSIDSSNPEDKAGILRQWHYRLLTTGPCDNNTENPLRRWGCQLNQWRNGSYTGKVNSMCFPEDANNDGTPEAHTLDEIVNCLRGASLNFGFWANEASQCYSTCAAGAPVCASTAPAPYNFVAPADPATSCPVPPAVPGDDYLNQIGFIRDMTASMASRLAVRSSFLEEMRAKADAVLSGFDRAAQEIDTFLESEPVEDLLETLAEASSSEDALENAPLKAWAIYAWQDDKDKWHIVKSEGRIPGKCGGQCWRSSEPEPAWPWVWSFTKNWGTRKCYTLGDSKDMVSSCNSSDDYHGAGQAKRCFRGGRVKSRISRYDEDKDLMLTFINKVPIWKFLFHHPERNPAPDDQLTLIKHWCEPVNYELNTGRPFKAFMINDVEEAAPNPNSKECYNAVGRVLTRGMKSETCADYFFRNQPSGSRGFGVKFADCGAGRAF